MKIVSGLIYHESNTFNPLPTGAEQFVVLRGQESLDRVASTQVFRNHGIDVVDSIYAMALSSGVVKRDVYEQFKAELLASVEANPDLDGIWLHLHGAMIVEEVGAAETDLLRALRAQVGPNLPISLTLDPHGNITRELTELATIIRAYRTIPHIDQPEIEARTAEELVKVIGGNPGRIGYRQVPIALSGEMALSARAPLNQIIERLDQVEQVPGILDASFFVGFAWADVPWNSASVLVVPETEEYEEKAQQLADELAEYILGRAQDFEFQMKVLDIDQTLETLRGKVDAPLFIADSGDNTTGGAVGASTVLLERLLGEDFGKRILVTTIFDSTAVSQLVGVPIGAEVDLQVGMAITADSQPVRVQGTLTHRGDLRGYMSSERDAVGQAVTISVGDVDVVLTDISGSFVTPAHFAAADLNIDDYDVIILKQGYLFPKLTPVAADYFMSLTPGATFQILRELDYENTEIPKKDLWGGK
ncbi:M81 family metallopeptidase [Actinomyces sp. F1_1611]